MDVTVLEEFTTYIVGKKVTFSVGKTSIPKDVIEECSLVEKGLVAEKKKPEGTK